MSKTPQPFREETLERHALNILAELGWQTPALSADGLHGRKNRREVVLRGELQAALRALNPHLSQELLQQAEEELCRSRTSMNPASANRELYNLLKDGVRIEFHDAAGERCVERVRVVDWENADNNRFLALAQLQIDGENGHGNSRPDIVAFVNGLPLVTLELKAPHRPAHDAFEDNFKRYRKSAPALFVYNAFLVASNGAEARMGSITAGWEHFFEWRNENEDARPNLETLLRGAMDRSHLLDIVENFTLFIQKRLHLSKIVAKAHQHDGVNAALQRVTSGGQSGKLGVFWHTQGSGKSYSMIFFTQKVLRKVRGNWSFLLVTDREDLGKQIYRNFSDAGVLTEDNIHASSAKHLKTLLSGNHRYLFTLIQKFQSEDGGHPPVLSSKEKIIVITDEAHRSQNGTFAANMRAALPKASFIGFTGTPLMDEDEKTRAVFGDYVSIYSFSDATRDGATLPLYYENRKPELHVINENIDAEAEERLDRHGLSEERLSEEQKRELQSRVLRLNNALTAPARLDAIAKDVVEHFLDRTQQAKQRGKVMVVSVDKITALKMHDLVQKHWQAEFQRTQAQLRFQKEGDAEILEARLELLKSTQMTVVVSEEQNEKEHFREHGLEITPHRERMNSGNLEDRFKDPADPLRIVFVCAMWMTGFDVPSLDAVYLDKPMRGHTLMQTITRANRVWKQKSSGLIVDYVGITQNLEHALGVYGGHRADDVLPLQHKTELLKDFEEALNAAKNVLQRAGVDVEALCAGGAEDGLGAIDSLLQLGDHGRDFIQHAKRSESLYRVILPDPLPQAQMREWRTIHSLWTSLEALKSPHLLDQAERDVGDLFQSSLDVSEYQLPKATAVLDLRDVGEWSKRLADSEHKNIEMQKLQNELQVRTEELIRSNPTRLHFGERLRQLIDEYNMGLRSLEAQFEQLLELLKDLNEEERRVAREELSPEALVVFDMVMRARGSLTKEEKKKVRAMVTTLMEEVQAIKSVVDWRTKPQSQAKIKNVSRSSLRQLGMSAQETNDLVEDLYEHFTEQDIHFYG